MDFFSGLHFWGGSALGSVLPFLFVLTVVVFFHELGHFLVARRCGVKIDTFSIGFSSASMTATARAGASQRSRSAATCASMATTVRRALRITRRLTA